ncbi:ABC transporter permease [Varibaculum vaginae]|uniref:ABC transporter permease n=1 Tax=Varibaculum vaginae TaxID=2364797 RepID=UPI000F08262E|nr:FtsX-like permease family protein [Varibaculum vaginae]
MRFLTKANLKAHSRQYIATACAIIICCIFICIASSFGSVMGWTIGSGETQLMKNTQVVITDGSFQEDSRAAVNGKVHMETNQGDPLAKILADRTRIRQANGADLELQPVYQTGVAANIGKKFIQMQGIGLFPPQFYRPPLSEGKAPTGKNQIALAASYLEKTGVWVGDSIEIQVPPPDDKEGAQPTTLKATVSGIIKRDSSMYIGQVPDVYLSPELGKQLARATGVGINEILVHTDQDPAELALKLGKYLNDKQLLTENLAVVTVAQQQSETASGQAEQIALQAIVLFFPLLAVLVCMGIVSVTFEVVLARRRRETALLRCVGATVAQVRRAAFLECLLVGIISAVIGTLIGWLGSISLVYGSGMIGSLSQTLEITGIFPAILSLVTGILVPLIGALRPTFGLGKIRPIAALNIQELNKKGKPKWHILHWIITVLFTILGSGLWVLAWRNHGSEDGENQLIALGGAIAGALILMCAALMICRFLLPAFTALFTRPFARKSATAKLAGENVKRDPHRTGATATALVLGVTLMATILIGTASVQKTVNDEINRRFTVDYSLISANPSIPLPKNELKKAAQVEGVSAIGEIPGIVTQAITDTQGIPLSEGQLTGRALENPGEAKPADTEPGTETSGSTSSATPETNVETGGSETADANEGAGGKKPQVSSLVVVTLPDMVNSLTRKRITEPQRGEIWLVGEVEKSLSQPVNLSFKGGGKLGVKAKKIPASASGFPADYSTVYGVISRADFEQLTSKGAKAKSYGVMAKFDLSRGTTDTIQTIQDFTNQFWELPSASMESSAMISSIVTMVLRVMMVILLCLLGISAIVALVGVANTLSLSVVDRAQENALLRAVGATRTQIRRMLITEGTMIGFGALIVGMALSVLFSWFVMQCMPFAGLISQKNIELKIPWLWVGLVVLITELFCFLASVLPGRRAAKASPIEALNAADQ